MSYAPKVRSDPFRAPAGGSDPPDVQFVRKGARNEIDKCGIGRPQRKMTVEPGRRSEDRPALRSEATIGNKQRISRPGRVVRQLGTVTRPVELGHAFQVWLGLSAERWHRPDADVPAAQAVSLANPKRHESAVRREPQGSNRGIDQFRCATARQVE